MTQAPKPRETDFARAWITRDRISLDALLDEVRHDGIGAVATFVGTVRERNAGRPVTGIDYEAYEPMAEREMQAIADEVAARWPGLRVRIVHRVGTLPVGEASVAIACAHERRAPAADAMRVAIEALKVRVPIWKREHYTDGDRQWIDPTRAGADADVPPSDHAVGAPFGDAVTR